jgi:pimeloyl-ACP methyl ester carboxylesterase
MPFVENQGAKLYWDEQGSGEPLLLSMGLSYPSYMWHRSRPVLANSYRTIALDNRGVGQSDAPPGIYSIALMASDAAAILHAAGVGSAHVFGASMARNYSGSEVPVGKMRRHIVSIVLRSPRTPFEPSEFATILVQYWT